MQLETIIDQITIDCKDDGNCFQIKDKIEIIKKLLSNTKYELIYDGNLCMLYAKKPIKNKKIILISTHIDNVYSNFFCHHFEYQQMLKGTFDNSLTNACLIYDMINDNLDDNIIIAFTGDEEKTLKGANEVVDILKKWNVDIIMTIVLDLTNIGYDKQRCFTIENYMKVNVILGETINEILNKYDNKYDFIYYAEPDETLKYNSLNIPCFSLCIPVFGDMHSDEGVFVKIDALAIYCLVLYNLANALSKKI